MLRKILIPIDFSETSAFALEQARALAERAGAELLVLHALELPVMPAGDVPYFSANLYEDLEKTGRRQLTEAVDALRAAGVRARSVFHVGIAAPTILDCARNEQPDLIVMGTHGRRGFSKLFIGSVAERVLRASPVPVLIARHAQAA